MSEERKQEEVESPFVLAAEVEPEAPEKYMSQEQFIEHLRTILPKMLVRIAEAADAGKIRKVTQSFDPNTNTKTITIVIQE